MLLVMRSIPPELGEAQLISRGVAFPRNPTVPPGLVSILIYGSRPSQRTANSYMDKRFLLNVVCFLKRD